MEGRTIKVLHVSPMFYPATYWGGPIYSVYGLCNGLVANPGIELRVLTTDSANPRERLSGHKGAVRFPVGYTVYYARRLFLNSVSFELLAKLWSMVRWADVVHLTGVYSFPTIPALAMCRLFGKPVVWSPRGSLQRWEKSRKPTLKRWYEMVCNAIVDSRRCVLHVTSETEAAESAARVRCRRIELIPNGVDIPGDIPRRTWCPEGKTRVMYIGRLDPKKGIENLIEAIAQSGESVTLDVFCTGDATYEAALKRHAQDRHLAQRVIFHGHISGQEKTSAFWRADLCVLPSFTENFGMTVAEALAHGVPVIVSKGAPWPALEERRCGKWVSNEPASLARAIRDMQTQDLEAMGARGRKWMQSDYTWNQIAERMRSIYEWLSANGHDQPVTSSRT